ncbi:MAG: type II and III secretion system protein family protein [Alphaproteobacteria bacterium]|nr:type II and III secretion system protein family protein [Alphaproteobacteria bacterium]
MEDKAMTGVRRTIIRGLFIGAFVTAGSVGLSGWGANVWASKGDLEPIAAMQSKKTTPPLSVTWGKAEIVSLPGQVSDVMVANPSIVDVQAVQANKLYIVGMNIGDTNIIALDEEGNVIRRIDVHVSYDLQAIQSLIESLFPDEDVKVGSVHDQILLTGTVSSPENASKITNLVGHYVSDLQDEDNKTIDQLVSNLMEVRGEQQVMLKVKIVEAKRSVIKELGLDTRANNPNELAVSTVFGATPPASTTGNINAVQFGAGSGLALNESPIGIGSAFLDSRLRGIGQLGLFLQALEQEHLVNVLAEPNLTAVSGQEAGFLAGGEFPVPAGLDQSGNVTIEFRSFGVSLNFKPVVLSSKRINLQLKTEVSSLDSNNAVTLSNFVIPGLDIRRTDTTVEIPSGGSLMIAGLLKSETTKELSGLPGIKNTPVLGKLISSDSFNRDESELVVIVTGYLVQSYGDKEQAQKVSKQQTGQMAKIFETNVRRMFKLEDEDDVFAGSGPYGYMLD